MTENNNDNTHVHIVLTQGTMVSHYRIIEKIGAGGMGEVFLAEDTALDRKVALKFLPSHLADQDSFKSRFIREAKATAKLNHPNIVTIFEVGEHENRTYFAMEFVDGRSLKTVVKDDKLMLDKIVEMAIKLGEGLDEAHKAGIIHRDIKPANIVIDRSGRPKILDFGLATISGVEQLTKTGSTLGTVGYMSPEQIQGHSSDHRTDLFSFGVLLYEMIAGRRPFESETEASILHAILNDPHEPLSRFRSGVPDDFERIIDKLLEKSPELRYQSASGVVSDLKRLDITGQLRPSTEVQIQKKRKMVVVLPFENLGPADDEYFADGMTEEIISRLAVVKKLGVISRTSAMQYKGSGKSIADIGRELNVDYVLEGTVRWSKGKEVSRVRITPQLIKVIDDTHLWADRYDRTLEDIFDVQSDIAEKVIEQLNITLLEPEKELIQAKPTENMDAYNSYLRAMELFNDPDYSKESLSSAIDLLNRAIKLDSQFSHAYAYLATCHTRMYFFKYDASPKQIEMAKEALEKAKAINNAIPEIYFAEASIHYHIERDHEKAIAAAEIAAKTMPVEPNWLLFAIYRRQGRLKESLAKIKFIETLKPNDPMVLLEIGITYSTMNKFDEAEKYMKMSESIAPDQSNAYGHLQFVYIRKNGDFEKMKQVIERMPKSEEDDWTLYYIYSGQYDKALENLIKHDYPTINNHYLYFPGKYRAEYIRYAMGESVAGSENLLESINHLKEKISENPNDYRTHGILGVCYALNNEEEKAIEAANKAYEIMPLEKDWLLSPIAIMWLAGIYSILGKFEQACDQIEILFSKNTFVTAPWIDLEPYFKNIKKYPRYIELIKKYTQSFS